MQATTTYSYQGNTVTVTDPAGKWKTFTTDGFGNLIQVTEPNPYGGSNYLTSYTYDLLNHLIGVSMPRSTGTQTRSWTYGGNFLTSATNPENGTVSYTYSGTNIATRTDAKGQVTTYSYDSLARLTQVQHYPSGLSNGADPCQTVNYYYDGTSPSNSTYPQNANGHLSAVQYLGGFNGGSNPTCNTTFTEMYTYGVPGAPTGKQLTVTRSLQPYPDQGATPMSLNWNATYTYDTEGRTTAETYPTDNNGATASLSYTFDSMGRLNTMTDNIANQQIVSSATYGPANELLSISGANGWLGETFTYNSLKQLTQIAVPGVASRNYNYPSTGNNGKISSETNAPSGETVTYTYDALNRLATAENSGASPSWGQSFTYDGFGNLTQTNVIQGSAPTMTASYDVNNHQGGEDANGNPGSIPVPALGTSAQAAYDVENRLLSVYSNYQNPEDFYSYDPANKRVWRGIVAPSGAQTTDEITFWSLSGRKMGTYQITWQQGCDSGCQYAPQFYYTQTGTNYYFGSKLVKDNSGWVYTDRLGSIKNFYPYGIERPSATANGTEKFTGYFRDSETGNDYAVNRYESPGTGRFLTPDRMTGKLSGPGTLNLYSYVGGDPVNRTDPSGQFWCSIGSGDYAGCDLVGPDSSGNCWVLTALGADYLTAGAAGCSNVIWGDPSEVGGGTGGCDASLIYAFAGGSSGSGTDCGIGQPAAATSTIECEIQLFAGQIPGTLGIGYHTWIVTTVETVAADGTVDPTSVVTRTYEAGNSAKGGNQYNIDWQPKCLANQCWLNKPTGINGEGDGEYYGYSGTLLWDTGLGSQYCPGVTNINQNYNSFPNNTFTYQTLSFNSNSFTYTLLFDAGYYLSNPGAQQGIALFGWGNYFTWP